MNHVKKRMNILDAAKGIGMLFVVFAHVNYTPEILVLIYSFHMPLFFIISGMLFDGSRYSSVKDFFRRRVKALIIPYILFHIFSILYAIYSELAFPELFDYWRRDYITFVLQIIFARGSSGMLNTPLWFVPCLLVVEYMYTYISKLRISLIIPLVVGMASLGWLLQSGILGRKIDFLPWTLDSALYAMSFFCFR